VAQTDFKPMAMHNIINDANDANDGTGFSNISSWHSIELVELHTIAWKCGMKISHFYGSTQPDNPTYYGLREKHYNQLYFN
jgi:hypothetical protein